MGGECGDEFIHACRMPTIAASWVSLAWLMQEIGLLMLIKIFPLCAVKCFHLNS